MCNLYSITTNQAAIIALFRVINRYIGNLPPMPGVFPDYPAPVVNNADGEREMVMMRVFGKRSEARMLVHVEGVKNRDARLVGLDSRAAVPAHLRERMIGFQDHERISDIGEERYSLHGLQDVRADMH